MSNLGQILIVALFAIVFLGPQKTLELAFSAGKLWGKAQSYLRKIKSELDGSKAVAVSEFKNLARGVEDPLRPQERSERFTAAYTPAALSSERLQQEIDDLRQKLQCIDQKKNKKIKTRSVKVRRHACRIKPKI